MLISLLLTWFPAEGREGTDRWEKGKQVRGHFEKLGQISDFFRRNKKPTVSYGLHFMPIAAFFFFTIQTMFSDNSVEILLVFFNIEELAVLKYFLNRHP